MTPLAEVFAAAGRYTTATAPDLNAPLTAYGAPAASPEELRATVAAARAEGHRYVAIVPAADLPMVCRTAAIRLGKLPPPDDGLPVAVRRGAQRTGSVSIRLPAATLALARARAAAGEESLGAYVQRLIERDRGASRVKSAPVGKKTHDGR